MKRLSYYEELQFQDHVIEMLNAHECEKDKDVEDFIRQLKDILEITEEYYKEAD